MTSLRSFQNEIDEIQQREVLKQRIQAKAEQEKAKDLKHRVQVKADQEKTRDLKQGKEEKEKSRGTGGAPAKSPSKDETGSVSQSGHKKSKSSAESTTEEAQTITEELAAVQEQDGIVDQEKIQVGYIQKLRHIS